jgi:hypothetical protein
MTDRLKEWLDEQDGPEGQTGGWTASGRKALRALRAVMELHSPRQHFYRGRRCGPDSCTGCGDDYPCEVIRAIEKETIK